MYYKDKTDGPAPVIDVVRAVSIIRRQYFSETHQLTIVDYQFFLPLLLVKENLVYIQISPHLANKSVYSDLISGNGSVE